jgi:AcrR family transcriptional regulator
MSAAADRRTRNPRGQGHLLRERLVNAAAELLSGGYSENDLSLRGVAREAGVAATSVYLHFEDREALLWAVIEDGFGHLEAALRAAVPDGPQQAADLREYALAYCRFGLSSPGRYHLLFGSDRVAKKPRRFEDLPGASVFLLLQDAVSRTGRRSAEANFMATTSLWVSLHGIVTLRLNKPQFPWPPVDDLVDWALHASFPKAFPD